MTKKKVKEVPENLKPYVVIPRTIKKVNIYDTINAIENANIAHKQLVIDLEVAVLAKQSLEDAIIVNRKIYKELVVQLLEELK